MNIKFGGYLKQIICQLASLTPTLKLRSGAVLYVLEVELDSKVVTNQDVRDRNDD